VPAVRDIADVAISPCKLKKIEHLSIQAQRADVDRRSTQLPRASNPSEKWAYVCSSLQLEGTTVTLTASRQRGRPGTTPTVNITEVTALPGLPTKPLTTLYVPTTTAAAAAGGLIRAPYAHNDSDTARRSAR
jgi:hypothetical protein